MSSQRIADGRRHAFNTMMRRVEARQETAWNKNVYMTETSRHSTRNLQVEDPMFHKLRESLETIDRWQFGEEIEGLKRQLHEKDRQLEQNIRTNANTAANYTSTATSPCVYMENNSSHNATNHMDIVHELLQLRHSHTVLQTQYDHQTVQIQNSMMDANRALDSIVHLEGHTLHGRHMCASAQCVGWLLSARQGLEAVVSTLSMDDNAVVPPSTKPEDLPSVLSKQPTTPEGPIGSVEPMSTVESARVQTLMEMCKRLELENQVLKEKVTQLDGIAIPSKVEPSVKVNNSGMHDKANDNNTCGSGESKHEPNQPETTVVDGKNIGIGIDKNDDTSSLDHASLVRLLRRINREREEITLLLVQQSTAAVTMKAQADLIPQYRQEIQKMHQELLQWKEMCRQERQQSTLLQHKLHRALKALTGSENLHHFLSADLTNMSNNVHDTVLKSSTATTSSSQQSRPLVDTPLDDDHHHATNHIGTRSVRNSGTVAVSADRTANLQAALSPIRLLAHQLAQADDRDYQHRHHRHHRHSRHHHHRERERESTSPHLSSSHSKHHRQRSSPTNLHSTTQLQPLPNTQPLLSNNDVPVGNEAPAVSTAVPTMTMRNTQINHLDPPDDHPPMTLGADVEVDPMGASRTFLSSSPSFDTSSPSSTSTSSPVITSLPVVVPPPLSVLSLPPTETCQLDSSALNPSPVHTSTLPIQPQDTAADTTTTATSIPILVQIERDIAQLDGEIEDLQVKLAQTVGRQAHQKMNDLLFKTSSL